MKSREENINKIKNPIVKSIVDRKPSKDDPFGSYTGLPIEEYEKPLQDADDL